MEKIKKWRRIALGLLSLLFFVVISLAVVQIIPARADEELVLSGNTAAYDFINVGEVKDGAVTKKFTYNAETNEWTIPEAGTFGTAKTLTISFQLRIITDGSITLQYKLNYESNNKSFKITSTAPDFEGLSLEGHTYLTSDLQPDLDKLNSRYYVGNTADYPNYPGNDPSDNRYSLIPDNAYLSEYGDRTTFTAEVKAGDVITITYEPGGNANKYNNFSFKGLNIPNFRLTAQVAEGQETFGKVVADRADEQNAQTKLTVNRKYYENVTFTAKPEPGYIAYWKDADGNIISRTETFTIKSIDDSYTNAVYTACFEKLSEIEGRITFDEPSADNHNVGWEKTTSDFDIYTLKGIRGFSSEESVKLSSSLTWIVYSENENYLKFSYQFLHAANTKAKLMMTIDGKDSYAMKRDKNNNNSGTEVTGLATTETEEDTQKFADIYVWVDEGYHEITWTFTYEGTTLSEDTSCVIQNPCSSEQPYGSETFELTWNPHLAKLYLNGVEQIADTALDTTVTATTLEWGKPLVVGIIRRGKTVESSITGEPVSVSVNSNEGVQTNFTSGGKGGTMGVYETTSYRAHVFVKCDESENYRVGYSLLPVADIEDPPVVSLTQIYGDYTLNPEEDHVKIDYMTGFKEGLPGLKVSAVAQKGLQSEQISEITNNQLISFTFGEDNSLTGQIKTDYEGRFKLDKNHLSVIVDGVALDSNALQEFEGIVGFVLNNVSRSTINVTYKGMPSYFYSTSASSLTFKVEENNEKGINGIVHTGTISISDTGAKDKAWVLDVERATVDNLAYKAGAEIAVDASGNRIGSGGLSKLAFDLGENQQKGVLTFEFQMDGAASTIALTESLSFTNIGAQLFTKFDSDFTLNTQDAIDGKYDWGKDNATRLAWADGQDGGMDTIAVLSENVTRLANGWFRAKISVGAGQRNLYLAFVSSDGNPFGGTPHKSFLSIRNVNFLVGNASVEVNLNNGCIGSFDVTKGEEKLYTATQTAMLADLTIGDTVKLTANVSGDEKVYGWFVDDLFYSDATEIEYEVISATTKIEVFIQTKNYFAARIGKVFYETLQSAISAAQSGADKSVIIVNDNEISGNFDIPANVSLILPHDANGAYFTSGTSHGVDAQSRISWATTELEQKYKKYTLTIAENATVNVYGKFIVGGVIFYPDQSAQGHTSGAYSHLINNGTINVEKDGVMDVYGRVTGTGSIDVKSEAKLYEPFLILDFPGGSYTLDIFMTGLTPFRRYAMINIECKMTINYGGQLIGHAGLYALSMLVTLDQPFISYDMGGDLGGDGLGRDTMIMLKPNSSVTVTYDANRVVGNANASNNTELVGLTTLEFTGGAIFSYMQFTALGITIPTTSVYFSIPYNFHLKLTGKDAVYETRTDFTIMPGAIVEVCEGATLHLHASATVYDGLKQGTLANKSYPTADDLKGGQYSKSGNLIVNGKLIIDKKWGLVDSIPSKNNLGPATFLGIVQTNGTGQIEIVEGTILNGTIVDGLKDQNYFAYTTTARVWDKVHDCFGELVAGHTYTATSGDDFTLNELKYTNTANGAETETLALSSNMVGTWKVDHDENHKYNWTPVESDKLADGELFKKIDRTCTELGCDHKEEKYLFSAAADLGSRTFRGSEFKESDLVELFKKYFTKDALDSFPEEIKVTASGFGVAKDVNEAGYSVTITLDKGVWLDGDSYISNKTFKWSITRLSLEGVGIATPTQPKTTYNGEEQKLGVTVKANGIDGNLQSGTDYEIVSYSDDTTNVGEVTVTINGKGNYEGTITCTYQIVAKEVNLKLTKQSAAYSGTMPEVDRTQYTTDDIFEGDEDNVKITIDFATKEGVTWKVGQYTLTASLKNTNGHENYVLGSVENNTNAFEITKKAVTVTVQAQHKTYNGGAQSYDAEWTADGLVNEEQNSVLGVTLSATGTDANSYDVTATYDESGNYTVTFAGADELQTAGNTIKSAFVIDRLNIEGADIQVAACTYNGKAQQPTLTVTKDGLTVTYTAEYSNNTNAGDASVEVTGNGNFTGTASTTFTIGRAKVTITPERKISPKGQDLLELTVSFSGFCGDDESKFLKGTDYTVTTDATKDKEPGDYDITVELLTEEKWTNYTFEVKEGKGFYQITAEVFANVKFEGANSAEYDGETHSYTVTLGDPGGDTKGTFKTPKYTYKKNDSTVVETMKDVGTYTVEAHITFKESKEGGRTYETTITATFTITAKDIRDAVIELENTTLTYAHKELQPKVTNVTVGTLTLTEQEYEVSYSANTNVGEATVTVTASGNFTGTATTNFTITARSLEGAQITVKQGSETLTYNGNAQKPDVTVTLEIDGDTVTLGANDYTADYTSNTNVGKATVTVTGQGNYQASAVNAEAFTIKAKAVNVTILAQSVVYAGLNTAPTLEQGAEKWTAQQGAICGSDDLQITLKAVENEDHLWSARTYEIDGVSANENYSVTFTKGTLTIQKRAITVTIADKSSEYGETYATPTWSTQDELGAGDNDEALGITLAIAGAENKLAVGTYKISGQASNANYAVTFAGNWDAQTGETDGGVYTVEKRKVTIEIIGQSDIYNNEEFEVPQEENEGWKVTAGSILEGDDLHIVLTKAAGKTVTPEGYAITGKYTEGNYEVTWVNGVYMIEKRPVTVKIANQSGAVYHYKHNYALDGTKWEVLTDAGKGLASGEEKSVLHVTLKTDTMSDAGDYPISGEWANDNYEVTFVGDYEKTETQSGHAGIYTIAKADVTNEATFMMAVKTENGDPVHSTSEGSDGLRVAYEGKTLVLVCHASIDEDEGDTRDLEVTIDPETLNIEGEYEVKITIVDKNYMGTAKYKVVVTDAKGYTPKLKETLAKLQELAEGLDADALTAEDFGAVKAIYDAMQGLDDAEREVGADDLAAYEELVESWNSMTEIDAVIETAESIADSAIGWLAQTSAVLTALAGVAYIGKKGGLLK